MGTLKIIIILLVGSLLSCAQEKSTKNEIKESRKIDSVAVTQAVISMHQAVTTKDLSDSLVFHEWTKFFTSDLLYAESEGTPAIEMGKENFKRIREAFQSISMDYDNLIIDHVDASCDIAYVSYHYNATVTTIATDEAQVIARSALAILKKNSESEWKVAYQAFH